MRKFLTAMLVIAGSAAGIAATHAEDIESYIRSYYVRPCESWRWIRTSDGQSGYVCSFQGRAINVPDANDVDRAIRDLENTVADLEARVAELEAERR